MFGDVWRRGLATLNIFRIFGFGEGPGYFVHFQDVGVRCLRARLLCKFAESSALGLGKEPGPGAGSQGLRLGLGAEPWPGAGSRRPAGPGPGVWWSGPGGQNEGCGYGPKPGPGHGSG